MAVWACDEHIYKGTGAQRSCSAHRRFLPRESCKQTGDPGPGVSTWKITVLVIALTIVLVAYQFMSGPGVEPPVSATQLQVAKPDLPVAAPASATNSERVATVTADEAGCLTFAQLQQLPTVAQDATRLIALQTHGLPVAPYESFDDATLRAFADQGDSAAMAVIGAAAVLRAYGVDEALATDWLNDEYAVTDLDVGQAQLSSVASLQLNEAAFWFYQAALHGRLFALQHYGAVRSRLFGGPVGMGWISQDEYDALGDEDRSALLPTNVYTQAIYDIAPQLREGLVADLSRNFPESDLQRSIRESLRIEFEDTILDLALPGIEVAPAASPGLAEVYDQICTSELQENLWRLE